MQDQEFESRKDKAMSAVDGVKVRSCDSHMMCVLWSCDLQETYKPQRRYKKPEMSQAGVDEETQVHTTLLEYGRYTHTHTSCVVLFTL